MGLNCYIIMIVCFVSCSVMDLFLKMVDESIGTYAVFIRGGEGSK